MRIFLTLLCIFLFTIAPAVCGQERKAPESGPVLQVGDVIRISVWRKPELSGEYQILADSTIADPFYMSVRVAGIPLAVAVERVLTHVERFESDPQVLIEPLFRIMVSGEVKQPGLINVPPGTTVVQAFMLAGGATERGKLDRVRLIRLEGEYIIDLTRPQSGLASVPVKSGDFVMVERKTMLFRDYLAPASSVVGAAASLLHIYLRFR
jgi:protein involved in polysaccharide export with SLBB domain